MGNTQKPPLTYDTFDTIVDELSSIRWSVIDKLSAYSRPNESEQLIIFDRYNYHYDKYNKPLKYNNVIHALIKIGFKPLYLDNFLMSYAIHEQDVELVKVLTDKKKCQKNTNSNVTEHLIDAIRSNAKHEIITVLCKTPGCEFNEYCLMHAIWGDIATLNLLIDNGADINLFRKCKYYDDNNIENIIKINYCLETSVRKSDMFMHIFNHPKLNRELIDFRDIFAGIIVANPSLAICVLDSPHFNIDFTTIYNGQRCCITDVCLWRITIEDEHKKERQNVIDKVIELKGKRKVIIQSVVPTNSSIVDIINEY